MAHIVLECLRVAGPIPIHFVIRRVNQALMDRVFLEQLNPKNPKNRDGDLRIPDISSFLGMVDPVVWMLAGLAR